MEQQIQKIIFKSCMLDFKKAQQLTIEENYGRHVQAMKILNSSSKAFQKISKSYFDIKSQIIIISQSLQHTDYFPGISHGPAKTLIQIFSQTNSSIADHCKEYSLQLSNLCSMYTEMVKQHYSKYREDKNNLNHYLDKVKTLNPKSEETDRYQRNQDKLKAAKANYAKRSKQFNIFLVQTNEEASKIWEKNFVGVISVFAKKYSQTLQDVHSLVESNESEQIILDEEDCELHLSPKNSLKSLTKPEHFHEKVEKLLLEAQPEQSSKTPIIDIFKQKMKNNAQVNMLPSKQNNNLEKLFGLKSPTNQAQTDQIKQSLNGQLFQKNDLQNDFFCFDNILSEKTKSQPLSMALSFSDFNIISQTTLPVEQATDKNESFSLIDL